MKNYICINGKKIQLTPEQIAQLTKTGEAGEIKLESIPEGDTFKIGRYECVVLQQAIDGTAVILKEPHPKDMVFGSNNNYDGSSVDKCCNDFADSLASMIGADNILPHTVDLTSNDGLKDYGTVERRASLLTAEQYRRYVHILDQYKPDRWWWLATPDSTASHECERWVLCVSPRGRINYFLYNYRDFGVRPFCILNSTIFVSK